MNEIIEKLKEKDIDLTNKISSLVNEKKELNTQIKDEYLKESPLDIGDLIDTPDGAMLIAGARFDKPQYHFGKGEKIDEFLFDCIEVADVATHYFTSRDSELGNIKYRTNEKKANALEDNYILLKSNASDFVKEYMRHKAELNSRIISRLRYDDPTGESFNLANSNKLHKNGISSAVEFDGVNVMLNERLKNALVYFSIANIDDFKASMVGEYKKLHWNKIDSLMEDDIENKTNKCKDYLNELATVIENDIQTFYKPWFEKDKIINPKMEALINGENVDIDTYIDDMESIEKMNRNSDLEQSSSLELR